MNTISQLLSNLPIGSKVKFGKHQVNAEDARPITWTIVAKNHQCTPAYPENSVTLHATNIIDLRCFDAKEPNNSNSNRQKYGNNRYSVSNIHQWLNSSAGAGLWYSAQHSADQSPNTSDYCGGYNTQYAERPGFLYFFTDTERSAILNTTVRVILSSTDGGSYEDIDTKVFLPSRTELDGTTTNNIAEGENWGYFTSNTSELFGYMTQQCYSNSISTYLPNITDSCIWYTRTPVYTYARFAYTVNLSGGWNQSDVCCGFYGIRPALNLSSSLLVSESMDSDGCYTFDWNGQIIPDTPIGNSVTLHGVTYENVNEIHYVQNGVSWFLKKLVSNGSTVWQHPSARIVEGVQTFISIADTDTIVGYSHLTVDENDLIQGGSVSYSAEWATAYSTYQSLYPYICYITTGEILAGALESTTEGYGFSLGADGYYISSNNGVNSSYSYGKLLFNFTEATEVTFQCISYGENNYDYGIISNLDTELTKSYSADTANVFHSFKSESSADVKTYTMTVPAGSHYITFKYIKDGSGHHYSDHFKIRPVFSGTADSWYKIVSATSTGADVLPLSVGA